MLKGIERYYRSVVTEEDVGLWAYCEICGKKYTNLDDLLSGKIIMGNPRTIFICKKCWKKLKKDKKLLLDRR